MELSNGIIKKVLIGTIYLSVGKFKGNQQGVVSIPRPETIRLDKPLQEC